MSYHAPATITSEEIGSSAKENYNREIRKYEKYLQNKEGLLMERVDKEMEIKYKNYK